VKGRDPLLIEVLVALGAGNLTIGPIHCPTERVAGYAVVRGKKKGAVRIDLSHDAVDTALHELIHRLRPRWTEQRVLRQTTAFMRELSDAERDRICQQIQAVATVTKRPMVVD